MKHVWPLVVGLLVAPAVAAPPPQGTALGIGIEESLERPSVLLEALARARATPRPSLFVRLNVEWNQIIRAASGDWSVIDTRLDAYRRQSIAVIFTIGPRTRSPGDSDASVAMIRAVASHLRGRVVGYQLESGAADDVRSYAYELKLVAVQVKAIDPDLLIAQSTTRANAANWLNAVYAEGTAAYVDLAPVASAAADSSALLDVITANDPTARRLWIGTELGGTADEALRRLLLGRLAIGSDRRVIGSTFDGSAEALAGALPGVAFLNDLFAGELETIEDKAFSLTIEGAQIDVRASVPHQLIYNLSNGATYLVYWNAGPTGPLRMTLVDPTGRTPVLRDPVRREVSKIEGFTWDPSTKVSQLVVRTTASPLVVDFSQGNQTQFISRSDVRAAAALSVEEIVARNQLAQTAQANAFKTLMASLRLEMHFRPNPTQVFDVVSENAYFFAPDTVEWEERTFSVNGTRWGPDHPGLPLLQAEKVLTLPLDLRLTADYRYRLAGIESVGERRCYVVAFEPAEPDKSRYRGRVWIDRESFIRLKLQTIQTDLTGPIVSNEETTFYEGVQAPDGRELFLIDRLHAKQLLMIAGRNLLLEKEQHFTNYRIDDPRFETERQEARAGRGVMFRDTDAGVRYLVKQGNARVVSETIRTSSKAMAFGTTIDPTFAYPLPIFGLNYLNFNVKGTGNQFAMLFAGVFIAGNLQAPKLGRTPFDVNLDFFAIAVPGSDLRFDATGERADESLMSIPTSMGVNLGYQFTPFQKFTGGFSLRHDSYFRSPDTAEGFLLPRNTLTLGATLGYEFSRKGYRVGATVSHFTRSRWMTWGGPGDFNPDARTYRRHSVKLEKDFLLSAFQSIHAGAAWYGGARLDRFSTYQFGLFDEVRMHGVPSAGIRFDELVLLRGSYSFNIFDIYRLDVFADHARGRSQKDRTAWERITGTGASITLKAPWKTMLTIDVGKSWIPALYRGTGSTVLQVLLLKPL